MRWKTALSQTDFAVAQGDVEDAAFAVHAGPGGGERPAVVETAFHAGRVEGEAVEP